MAFQQSRREPAYATVSAAAFRLYTVVGDVNPVLALFATWRRCMSGLLTPMLLGRENEADGGGDTLIAHPQNWAAGWALVLAAFVTGGALGLFFHRENFLGGYNSFRRRIWRLGHIALAALGMINLLFALSPWPGAGSWQADAASALFIVGGVSMPAVCFLTGWRTPLRHLFFIPVLSLFFAVLFTLMGGWPCASVSWR